MANDPRHPMDIERTLHEMRGLRIKHNMSQNQMADLLGVDRSMISKWESGATRPSYEHLVMVHRILHGLKLSGECVTRG